MNMLKKYDLFIFDWDNTLVKTSFLINATHLFKRRYSSNYKYRQQAAKDATLPTNLQVMEKQKESQLFSLLYDLYIKVQKPQIKPHTVELLKFLKHENKRIAVFSDGKTYRIFKELRLFDLYNYFDIVLGADLINSYKPNPAGINYILKKFKMDKARSIYIGDMFVDITTAKLAGIASCAISNGLDTLNKLKKANPDYMFASLGELLNELKKEK